MIVRLAGTVMIAALLSCDVPPQVVELTTDRTAYTIGDEGVMMVTNFGPSAIGWRCPQVERMVEGVWERLGLFPGYFCIMEPGAPTLQPGLGVELTFLVTPERFTAGGDYRLVIFIDGEEGILRELPEVYSNAFTVAN